MTKVDSVSALHSLLKDIGESKSLEQFDSLPLAALTSQGKLARLTWPDSDIVAMSLNTLKNLADTKLDGGFRSLDDARRRALEVLEAYRKRIGRPARDTKAALREQLKAALGREGILREDLAHLTGAFRFSLNRLREYADAPGNAELRERLALDLAEAHARASLVRSKLRLVSVEAPK